MLDSAENQQLRETFETIKATGKGLEGLEYRLVISPLDCTGCGNCADICPAKTKALVMTLSLKKLKQDYQTGNMQWMKYPKKDNLMDKVSVKGSQFCKPYFEFSGACAAAEKHSLC